MEERISDRSWNFPADFCGTEGTSCAWDPASPSPPQLSPPPRSPRSAGGYNPQTGTIQAPQPPPPPRDSGPWHLVLLERSFRDRSRIEVAQLLAKVLRFSEEEALRKTTDASMRLVKVSTYLDQREAFHYSQQLRDLGLAVQVVSNSGLPGSHSRPQTGAGENLYIVNRTPRRNSSETTAPGSSRARRNSYTELFEQVLTPSNRKAGPGGIAPAPPPPPRRAPSRGPARQLSAPPEPPPFESAPATARQPWPQAPAREDTPQSARQLGRGEAPGSGLPVSTHSDAESSGTAAKLPLRGALKKLIFKHSVDIFGQEVKEQEDEDNQDEGGVESKMDGSKLWDSVIDDLQISTIIRPSGELSQQQIESCTIARLFVFGHLGENKLMTVAEREASFKNGMGTKEEVCLLHVCYLRLDNDNSGRVDMAEFRKGAMQNLMQLSRKKRRGLLPGFEIPQELDQHFTLESESAQINFIYGRMYGMLFGKKSSIVLQDLMRLVWPCAKLNALQEMTSWCQGMVDSARNTRVSTPPVLDQDEFDGLCSVFRHYDEDGVGEIPFDRLVAVGLIYADEVVRWREEWDADGNGMLDMLEFCDMMCPAGYRATRRSLVGSTKDGRRVRFDRWIDGWRAEGLEGILLGNARSEEASKAAGA